MAANPDGVGYNASSVISTLYPAVAGPLVIIDFHGVDSVLSAMYGFYPPKSLVEAPYWWGIRCLAELPSGEWQRAGRLN